MSNRSFYLIWTTVCSAPTWFRGQSEIGAELEAEPGSPSVIWDSHLCKSLPLTGQSLKFPALSSGSLSRLNLPFLSARHPAKHRRGPRHQKAETHPCPRGDGPSAPACPGYSRPPSGRCLSPREGLSAVAVLPSLQEHCHQVLPPDTVFQNHSRGTGMPLATGLACRFWSFLSPLNRLFFLLRHSRDFFSFFQSLRILSAYLGIGCCG